MQIKPIKKVNISGAVAQQIQELIQEGVFQAGEKIPSERELCEKFVVSRTSVREALSGLISRGILERKSDGTYVREFCSDIILEPMHLLITSKKLSIADIYEARSILEIENAGLAASRATKEELQKLEQCILRMEDPKLSKEMILQISVEFHERIARATHNPILIDLFTVMFGIFAKDPRSIKNIRKSTVSHRDVFDQISSRNPEGAREAMRKHLQVILTSFKYGI